MKKLASRSTVLWSTLPSTSVLASKRKETVLKAFSIVHHERGDARLGHGAKGSPRPRFRHCAFIYSRASLDVSLELSARIGSVVGRDVEGAFAAWAEPAS